MDSHYDQDEIMKRLKELIKIHKDWYVKITHCGNIMLCDNIGNILEYYGKNTK